MQFNLNRFVQLLKRDFTIYKKPLFLFILGSFIILGLITTISIIDSEYHMLDEGYWEGWFGVLILGGGLLLTSVIFWEFKSPAGRVQYLSIPASNFEKCLSRWLYSLILYPILIVSMLVILKMISEGVTGSSTSDDFSWAPFGDMLKGYYLLHSVLFMFSIWFNKYVAPKTAIVGFLLIIATVILFYIAHRIIFYNMYESLFQINLHQTVMPKPEFQSFIENMVPGLAYAALVVIPVFFYIVSYFKMKEKVA